MKRDMILACLLTTLSAIPAYAGAFGPPAELTVNQMPRVAVPQVQVDDDILTPLPDGDSALPKLDTPQPAPAKLLGLTPADRITPAFAAPPQPTPIREEERPRVAEVYGPALPPQPAPEKVSFTPGTAIPFPPSADDWSARMPLGAQAPARETAKAASKVAQADGDDERMPAPQRPSRHSAARPAPADDDDNFDRPRHIVVRSNGEADGPCRGYTRNLGDGRIAEGTACVGGDGVWRVADEHLATHMRVARIYHVNSAPYYYASPSPYRQATGIAHLGLTLGSFWHFR